MAYVGVQHRTVTALSRIERRRAVLLMPPPGRHMQPCRKPASNAVQKPRKGPNENAKKMRFSGPTPDARSTSTQLSTIHPQLSGVSSQRSGVPDLPPV